jgi:hypothetical protein
MKLMISVGRGEKCMRLWNLMTGKKAGVLNFDRELLQSVKENKRSTGEGRGIIWDKAGEEFAIAFEWGVAVFGIVGFTSSHISTESPLTLRTGLNAQMQSHSIPDNQSAESAICRF